MASSPSAKQKAMGNKWWLASWVTVTNSTPWCFLQRWHASKAINGRKQLKHWNTKNFLGMSYLLAHLQRMSLCLDLFSATLGYSHWVHWKTLQTSHKFSSLLFLLPYIPYGNWLEPLNPLEDVYDFLRLYCVICFNSIHSVAGYYTCHCLLVSHFHHSLQTTVSSSLSLNFEVWSSLNYWNVNVPRTILTLTFCRHCAVVCLQMIQIEVIVHGMFPYNIPECLTIRKWSR